MSPQKMSANKKTQTDSRYTPLIIKDLPEGITHRKISHEAFSLWVRQLLFNGRQGTVGVKSRAEVNRSNKKPWKQKGTGRARAGTARSPLWKGGGVVFGPQQRIRTLDIPQKVKSGVLNMLLYNFVNNEKVLIVDWIFSQEKPRTKEAIHLLQESGIQNQSIILFVAPDDIFMQASFANIPNVQMVLYDAPNAYDLVSGNWWLVLKRDLGLFNKMVEKWI